MKKKRIFTVLILTAALLSGCGSPAAKPENTPKPRRSAAEQKEIERINKENHVGEGFTPPKGSTRNKKGQIVDPEGNTFSEDGSWQVPEGGHIDKKGRIIDRDGNVMGGGATVGSKG